MPDKKPVQANRGVDTADNELLKVPTGKHESLSGSTVFLPGKGKRIPVWLHKVLALRALDLDTDAERDRFAVAVQRALKEPAPPADPGARAENERGLAEAARRLGCAASEVRIGGLQGNRIERLHGTSKEYFWHENFMQTHVGIAPPST